jgi:hypothetical protein
MKGYASVSWRTGIRAAIVVALAAAAGACGSQAGRNLTSPSSIGDVLAAKPGVSADGAGTTAVSFSDFDAATLTVTVNTLTTSLVGQPYIDQGKIHLEILVDDLGNPLPCGSTGTWVRFDGVGGGIVVSGGATAHVTDLAALKAACGDSICIRAQYVTGGGATKVDTHFSDPTTFDVDCGSCTYTQGYWKNHYPTEWPADVISSGLTLGTVTYTAAQLQQILQTDPGGQGGANGLIQLAHQLIAAMLNVENGASDAAISSTLTSAHALIGALVVPPVGSGYLSPASVSALVQALDDYNNGVTGPGHCSD